jgi:hypothetical protein
MTVIVTTVIDGDRNQMLEVKVSYSRGFCNDRPKHGRGSQIACSTTAAGR